LDELQITKIVNQKLVAKHKVIWNVQIQELQQNQKLWVLQHHKTLVWVSFAFNNPTIMVNIQAIQNIRCLLCHHVPIQT
jgi:hypothetical protein